MNRTKRHVKADKKQQNAERRAFLRFLSSQKRTPFDAINQATFGNRRNVT
ncbi:hypothetical protein BIFADO_01701 [Bifidobacterium adolescentis L2-32]|uniref:Uncharacterized protein n=1 Tax=Bifidobacterium adolescentis L2-32 TaxID=411481 RepID=A7A765_BIFAD|nr:hypothetical protein BIFADO_01701 [Bifidobacterium adolescentis L2-32]